MVAGGLRSPVLWGWILVLAILLAGCLDNGDVSRDDDREQTEEAFDELDVPCDERERPVAYPWEQQVEGPEQIRCPGHFAVVDEGDGARAEVPVWKPGDWWQYRGSIETATSSVQCVEYRDEVQATDTYLNLSVYEATRSPTDCDGEGEQSRSRYYTQQSVSWILSSPEGFIRHEMLFPLADGKAWAYMDLPMGNLVDAQVTHDDDHEFGGETLEVWRVELTGKDLHTQEEWQQIVWYSDDARHKIREEFHKAGVQQYFWQLVDSIDGHGEDPGIL